MFRMRMTTSDNVVLVPVWTELQSSERARERELAREREDVCVFDHILKLQLYGLKIIGHGLLNSTLIKITSPTYYSPSQSL